MEISFYFSSFLKKHFLIFGEQIIFEGGLGDVAYIFFFSFHVFTFQTLKIQLVRVDRYQSV